jgi:hypothetical protein
MIRPEPTHPEGIIYNHRILTQDEELIPILLAKQQEAVSHFDITLRSTQKEVNESIRERWSRVANDLKQIELHSPLRLKDALFKTTLYKESLARNQLRWIGMRLNPPFFLSLVLKEQINEAEERKAWAREDQNFGYLRQAGTPKVVAWDIREVIDELNKSPKDG